MAAIRKRKSGLKPASGRGAKVPRPVPTTRQASQSRPATQSAPRAASAAQGPGPQRARKEVMGAHEVAVETSKFSHPEMARPRKVLPQELPYHYDVDRMALMVRDPWWLYTYWEVRDATMERFRRELGGDFGKAKFVLRVYDITDIIFDGTNANRFFDIQINDYSRNWYIDIGEPGRSWCVDYGLLLPDGRFITILRSNVVQTPLAGPSQVTDEEWMIPEEIWARLYGLAFGIGPTSGGQPWKERMQKALFSGVLSSPGITSGSPVRKQQRERSFWLVVDCELIVYGATEPDAAVTVQGKPIQLRKDGTFTLRFSLPDGTQVIPVQAVSADQAEERTITPKVTRETSSAERFLAPEAALITKR